jgi:hypothetical protein
MDISAHGLWAGAAAKTVNQTSAKFQANPLKVKFVVLWGILPDLLSFAPVFIWLFGNMIFGDLNFGDFPRPDETEPAARDTLPIFHLTSILYTITHSMMVFFAIFALVWLILRRPVWVMGGWLFHILIDIPTHSYKFYPTPFLWPFSEWKFDGFSWGQPWFMALNYSAIIIVYILLRRKKKIVFKSKIFC